MLALLILPAEQKSHHFSSFSKRLPDLSRKCWRVTRSSEVGVGLIPKKLDLSDLPLALLERWARLASGLPTRSLQRYAEDKRLALQLCGQIVTLLLD